MAIGVDHAAGQIEPPVQPFGYRVAEVRGAGNGRVFAVEVAVVMQNFADEIGVGMLGFAQA